MSEVIDTLNMLAGWAIAGSVAGVGLAVLKLIRRQNDIIATQTGALRGQEELVRKQSEMIEKQNALLKDHSTLAAQHTALLQGHGSEESKQIRLELFSKRYDVYTRMIQFCDLVKKRDGKLSRQDVQEFSIAINHGQFLFDSPAWEYVATMRDNGARLNELYESIYEIHKDAAGVEYLAAKPVNPALNKEFTTLINWFFEQPPAVKQQVLPYLDFTKLPVVGNEMVNLSF